MKTILFVVLSVMPLIASAQFGGGGGCSSGGLVDRYSDQSISGAKSFCSTATFNMGAVIGLHATNTLSLTPLSAASGTLYWGDKKLCDSSNNCTGVGGSVKLGGTGIPHRFTIFSDGETIINSVIEQDDLSQTINFNDFSLTLLNPTSAYSTIYEATGITAGGEYTIQTPENIIIQSMKGVLMQSPDNVELASQKKVIIGAQTDIEITATAATKINAHTIEFNPTVLKVNNKTGMTGYISLGSSLCGGNTHYGFLIDTEKGIVLSGGCVYQP